MLHSVENAATGDVHFVMSAALPFVTYISRIVQTCLRRNFKTYPLTMHKIVLTSSVMWLFDIIESVMSSSVPEKKVDPTAE